MTNHAAGVPRSPDEVRHRQQIIDDFSQVVDTITRAIVQEFSRHLARERLTLLQFHALRAVWVSGPALDMSSICAVTGLTPSSLTSIVERLAERGLVERVHDERDRRRIVATITSAGTVLMERLRADQLEEFATLLDPCSTEDLITTLDVFNTLRASMQEVYGTERPG